LLKNSQPLGKISENLREINFLLTPCLLPAHLNGHIMGWLQTSVRCLSVRCPSRGHISKTKQDRPIVTMQHSTDSVAAFRSSLRRPYGDILTSDENIQNIQILVRSPDQQSSIIVTPQALSTVENRVRRSESVVDNCRPLYLQHL